MSRRKLTRPGVVDSGPPSKRPDSGPQESELPREIVALVPARVPDLLTGFARQPGPCRVLLPGLARPGGLDRRHRCSGSACFLIIPYPCATCPARLGRTTTLRPAERRGLALELGRRAGAARRPVPVRAERCPAAQRGREPARLAARGFIRFLHRDELSRRRRRRHAALSRRVVRLCRVRGRTGKLYHFTG